MNAKVQGRRRGRPPTFDREAALDVAMALFWRYGYEGTTIAMLTEGAGFTAPTLYEAFGSKAALYREALSRYVAQEHRTAEAGPAGSPRQMVEAYLREAARQFTDPERPRGCMVSTATLQCGADSRNAAEATAALRTSAFNAFVAQLQAAKFAGDLPQETDPEALARFYAAIEQGMSVQAIDGADEGRLNALVDIALMAWPGGARR